MRPQPIKSVAAGRSTGWLHLACGHNISMSRAALEAEPRARPGQVYECPHCPDYTPEEHELQKSAARLWKEAGEP